MANLKNIKDYWDSQIRHKGLDVDATAFDFQLKNLEVYNIAQFFNGDRKRKRVLDLGCGTGYLGTVLTDRYPNLFYVGIDCSKTAIEYANKRIDDLGTRRIRFIKGDAIGIEEKLSPVFDVVITERLLINLGSIKNQKRCIESIGKVLKKGGHWLVLEGTVEGWEKLNKYRKMFGLKEIPNHWTQTKIRESEFIPYIVNLGYSLIGRKCFGMYYFLSRVVHPLNIFPNEPDYHAKFNKIALKIAKVIPDLDEIGHLRFYVFQKDDLW